MPHFIVEYSSNVSDHHDIDAFLDAIHERLCSLDMVPVPGIRVRAVEHVHTRIANGSDANHAFIAITIRLGPGRDAPTKHRLINELLDAAVTHIESEAGPLVIAWSCELQEIDEEFRVNKNDIAGQLGSR